MALPECLKLWNFKLDVDGWYWTVTGPSGHVRESTRFSSLGKCIDDAAKQGFIDSRRSYGLRGS